MMMDRLTAVAMGAVLLSPAGAEACAVCFGAKGQPVTEAAGGAIVFLLVLVCCVMAAFGSFVAYLHRRSKRVGRGAGGAA